MTSIAITIVEKEITILRAIQNKKPIYKSDTQIQGKRLKATTLAIAKLEEQ